MSVMLATFLAFVLLDQNEALPSDIFSHLTREKCIDELGCFNANSPFFDIIERPISLLPEDRESINTKFLLFTPENPKVPSNFSNIDGSLWNIAESSFNRHGRTKILVPGFMSSTSKRWKGLLTEALLMAGESNIFLVDWSAGDGPIYEQAVANTRVVGAEIALFIKHLQALTGIQPESVHIIGHSLGAHIGGYAGKRLKTLGRITAMDPAGPYFMNVEPVVRLDRQDALFVDAIHTNAAPSRFEGFGLGESIAHFDFYANGGHLQPGCTDMGQSILSFLSHPGFDEFSLQEIECNHVRAIFLFISSIRNTGCELAGVVCPNWEDFVSGKCGSCKGGEHGAENCIALGYHADRYASKIQKDQSINVFLNTTGTEPYCA